MSMVGEDPKHEQTPNRTSFATNQLRLLKKDAEIVKNMLEIGDQRLLASDGPINGAKPDLSAEEWGVVYRACKRIYKRLA